MVRLAKRKASVNLKLSDSSISLLSIRTEVLAPIEALHFVIEFTSKGQTESSSAHLKSIKDMTCTWNSFTIWENILNIMDIHESHYLEFIWKGQSDSFLFSRIGNINAFTNICEVINSGGIGS